jgi:molybdate transport system substrate-binding protein
MVTMSNPISGISSMATRLLLADAVEAWQRGGGAVVHIESVGGVDALRRVHDGERFDVVVLAGDAIEKLAAANRIVAGSGLALVRSPVAIAVRKGAVHPMVDTEAALRAAVLSARRLGYSTGPSGVALQKLFERWGITEAIRAQVVQAPPGVAVGTLLARGDVDLGFQQLSELLPIDGIDVIGAMPAGLDIVTTFSGAVCTASTQPEVARAWLDFIRSPSCDEVKRRHGMQPA